MDYRYLDLNEYKRKSHFEYFSHLAYPYVGVTANVDISDFIRKVKEEQFPFFLSFCYCVARAANSIPEFRQRILNDTIVEYTNCKTSHTVALENGTYCYCTLDSNKPFQEYLPYSIQEQEAAKQVTSTDDDVSEVNGLIFISTLPWLTYTSLVQPTPIPADSNPRITWGKYFEENFKTLLPVSVLCNHALVDGLHISQFYRFLDQQIKAFVLDV